VRGALARNGTAGTASNRVVVAGLSMVGASCRLTNELTIDVERIAAKPLRDRRMK